MKKETRDKALQLIGFIGTLTWLPLIDSDKVNDSQYHLFEDLSDRYDYLFKKISILG